ncbi:MAG: glycosyltransferase [Robiginitomaculum sp.]|nr:glycosyltransferase [Robiginitomaculum sp.]
MPAKSLLSRLKTILVKNRLAQSFYVFLVMLGWKKDRDLLRRISPSQKIAPTWSEGDDLSQTTGWRDIQIDLSKVSYNKNLKPKVLFLNSMGGSMSRLAQALMLHENIEASCYINAYFPRRNMANPLETNVNGVFTHDEWRDFMAWAVKEHDIVQSTTLPLWPAVAECYDWLTDILGQRHIWRCTGFVHHYLPREEVLPSAVYRKDLSTDDVPGTKIYSGKTFPIESNRFQLGENTMFYSSPEKGVYFDGAHKHWLPSIRSPERFHPSPETSAKRTGDPVRIYVPNHSRAMFKGMDEILSTLGALKTGGLNIEIITPNNVGEYFPEINGFKDHFGDNSANGAYPIPNHFIPSVLQRVDLVIDQIVMGSYGNTGIEAMMCGKPVIGQKNYDEIKSSPIINVNAYNLKSKLEQLIDNPADWTTIGEMGRKWAIKHHSPKAVAKVAADVYDRVLQSSSGEL